MQKSKSDVMAVWTKAQANMILVVSTTSFSLRL
jgi:hypothetical protein